MGNSNSTKQFGWVRDTPSEDDKFIKVKTPKYLPEKVNEISESLPEIYSSGNSTINSVRAVIDSLGLEFEIPETSSETISIRDCLEAQESIKFRRVKQKLETLKALIFKGYPVIFGMDFYGDNDWDPARSPYGEGTNLLGGLSAILVAYSDERSCFLVRNCWGKEWGMNGYFMLPYDIVVSESCTDFWVVDHKKSSEPRETVEISKEEVEALSNHYLGNTEVVEEAELPVVEEAELPVDTEDEEEIPIEHIIKPKKKTKKKRSKEPVNEEGEDSITIQIQKDTPKAIDPNCLIVDE